MKWTRLSVVLIGGIAGVLLLVACGSDPTATPTPAPQPTATPTPAPVAQPTEAPAPDPTATPTPDAMAAIEAEKAELIAAAQEEGELRHSLLRPGRRDRGPDPGFRGRYGSGGLLGGPPASRRPRCLPREGRAVHVGCLVRRIEPRDSHVDPGRRSPAAQAAALLP